MGIKENIEYVNSMVSDAAAKSGRRAEDIKVMAVSKTRTLEEIEEAYNAGFRLFGENRVQEAVEKFTGFHEDAELHIIGHLQSNKAKAAAGIAGCIQSVDRIKIARYLNRYSEELGKNLDIFLEYNTSGEESKSGFTTEDEYFRTIDEILTMDNLVIKGLMTIGPLGGGDDAVRKAFSYLSELFDRTSEKYPEIDLKELSMGMSSDFPIAIEEGATLVRIGTLLFGPRVYR